jgi:D-alanyl-D-alanine dipeptidase
MLEDRVAMKLGTMLATMLATCLIAGNIAAAAAELPRGFVYLADADPTIRQDIRYAGSHNFIGRPVEGYLAGECVLTERAAAALRQAQAALAAKKLSLIMWDCYRPARAVRDFLAWSKSPQNAPMKAEFFPNSAKAQLFALGYLATRSAHSRGSTVDLGIVPADLPALPGYAERRAFRGWHDRLRNRLRLPRPACKHGQPGYRPGCRVQPNVVAGPHAPLRLQALCA